MMMFIIENIVCIERPRSDTHGGDEFEVHDRNFSATGLQRARTLIELKGKSWL
jgi:hypothetical protein